MKIAFLPLLLLGSVLALGHEDSSARSRDSLEQTHQLLDLSGAVLLELDEEPGFLQPVSPDEEERMSLSHKRLKEAWRQISDQPKGAQAGDR